MTLTMTLTRPAELPSRPLPLRGTGVVEPRPEPASPVAPPFDPVAPPFDVVEEWGMASFPASDPPSNW
jgi:hypothetical protein